MGNAAIPTIDDLTAQWFTELLRDNGRLDDATTVAAVDVQRFGTAESMMSSLHRVALTFDGPTDAPASLIVKLASESDEQRFIATVFKFYEREIRFYNEIASAVKVSMPDCLLARINTEDHSFVLVLEQVTGRRQVDQIEGLSFDDARLALVNLADLHAPNWGKNLDAEAETFFRFDSPLMQSVMPDHFANDWAKTRGKVVDELPAEVIAMCDSRREWTAELLQGMHGADTICHGDFRAENLLFDDGDGLMALDFQLAAVAHGMTDVAYLISQSVNDEVAAAHADDLIDVYLGRLAEHGIVLDRDEAMAPYQAGLVFYMSIPISLLILEHVPERADRLGRAMLRRASAEVIRTGAHLRFGR
jgi:aminoglycoside phosphotransferase (APT) family kinase protein